MYLPEEWCNDAARRAGAKAPEAVAFQTKPQQAVVMLKHTWAHGAPRGVAENPTHYALGRDQAPTEGILRARVGHPSLPEALFASKVGSPPGVFLRKILFGQISRGHYQLLIIK